MGTEFVLRGISRTTEIQGKHGLFTNPLGSTMIDGTQGNVDRLRACVCPGAESQASNLATDLEFVLRDISRTMETHGNHGLPTNPLGSARIGGAQRNVGRLRLCVWACGVTAKESCLGANAGSKVQTRFLRPQKNHKSLIYILYVLTYLTYFGFWTIYSIFPTRRILKIGYPK